LTRVVVGKGIWQCRHCAGCPQKHAENDVARAAMTPAQLKERDGKNGLNGAYIEAPLRFCNRDREKR
jgi:hypothetical protein